MTTRIVRMRDLKKGDKFVFSSSVHPNQIVFTFEEHIKGECLKCDICICRFPSGRIKRFIYPDTYLYVVQHIDVVDILGGGQSSRAIIDLALPFEH